MEELLNDVWFELVSIWHQIPLDYKIGIPLSIVVFWFVLRPLIKILTAISKSLVGLIKMCFELLQILGSVVLHIVGILLLPFIGFYIKGGGKIQPWFVKTFYKPYILMTKAPMKELVAKVFIILSLYPVSVICCVIAYRYDGNFRKLVDEFEC